jgi:hypothetical protein
MPFMAMEATAAEAGRCTLPHTISYAEGSFVKGLGVVSMTKAVGPALTIDQRRDIFESHASPKRTGTRAPFFILSFALAHPRNDPCKFAYRRTGHGGGIYRNIFFVALERTG